MSDGIEHCDSEQLIIEVQKRPTLYDKNANEYNDKFVREKLWKEVCEAIIPNWGQLKNSVKERTGRDIQRKWKNIRDCFRKDLNNQRRCKTGQGKRKRRKYIFHDQLLFLLPTIQERERKYESAQSSGEEAEENTEETSAITEQSEKQSTYKPAEWRQKGRRQPVYPSYEETYVPAMQESEVEEIDEDKYFLLSLLPSFRNLSPDQKFAAKIEFLQTLRNLTYPTPSRILTNSSPVFIEQPHTSFESQTADNSTSQTKQETDDF